jgi:hypothetical protein
VEARGEPDERILRQCWAWAGGRCECKREEHPHLDRCNRPLDWERRGIPEPGGWMPRLRDDAPPDAHEAERCQLVCWACWSLIRDEGTGAG